MIDAPLSRLLFTFNRMQLKADRILCVYRFDLATQTTISKSFAFLLYLVIASLSLSLSQLK